MISSDTIRKLAVTHQTTELNIAREYAQHLFLSGFYQQAGTQQVMFKGGTALRLVYGSPRFSEDLDFSGFGARVKSIEDWVADASSGIEQAGVPVSIEESKQTSGGYLSILILSIAGQQISIQMEVSLRRKTGLKGRGVLISSDLVPAYVATLLPEDALVEEKLMALINRGKPRDFYDCYFMLRRNMIPLKHKRLLHAAKEALAKTKINFKTELKDFLPRTQQIILTDFKKTLMAELERW